MGTEREGLLQTLFTALRCLFSTGLFSANSFLLRLPPPPVLLIICHVLTHGPETKQILIIKHNYTRLWHETDSWIIEKEKTKYDNCVREKSNCAKQSYTHLINLASPGPVPSEKSYTFSSLFSLSANVLQKVI